MSGREHIEESLRVDPGQPADLAGRGSTWSGGGEFANLAASDVSRSQAAKEVLARGRADLAAAQGRLRAADDSALLIVFEGLAGAGTYSTIEDLTIGLDRHGVAVVSLGPPSIDDPAGSFFSPVMNVVPRRGTITILDGSYYADVVRARVDSASLDPSSQLPAENGADFWAGRSEDINAFERHLDRNGTKIVKFYLHVSAEQQRVRFLSRLDDPDRPWSTRTVDLAQRAQRPAVERAYDELITATSTDRAPWYVIPADDRLVSEAFVVSVVVDALRATDRGEPTVSDDEQRARLEARRELADEVAGVAGDSL